MKLALQLLKLLEHGGGGGGGGHGGGGMGGGAHGGQMGFHQGPATPKAPSHPESGGHPAPGHSHFHREGGSGDQLYIYGGPGIWGPYWSRGCPSGYVRRDGQCVKEKHETLAQTVLETLKNCECKECK